MAQTGDAEKSLELTKTETQIIRAIRDIDYGEIRIIVKAGEPIRIEHSKSIILG